MNAHQRCASCAYFEQKAGQVGGKHPSTEKDAVVDAPNTADGLCRRHAPRPEGTVKRAEWPKVYGKDWCGEWKSSNQEL